MGRMWRSIFRSSLFSSCGVRTMVSPASKTLRASSASFESAWFKTTSAAFDFSGGYADISVDDMLMSRCTKLPVCLLHESSRRVHTAGGTSI